MKDPNATRSPASTGPTVRFGALTGGYAAALAAPSLVLLAVEPLGVRGWRSALALLGVVGIVTAAAVARLVTGDPDAIGWLRGDRLPWLLPLSGLVPVFAHRRSAVEILVYLFAGIDGATAADVAGAAGFGLGIAACLSGELVVRTARNRAASLAVASEEVTAEWTAAWPPLHRTKVQAFVVLPCLAAAALIALRYSARTLPYTLSVALAVVFGLNSVFAARSFRATPSGVEWLREGRVVDARRFLAWSRIDGFSVTDRSVVLHRPGLRMDVRFSRSDIGPAENEVVAALDAHIDRRNR